MINLDATPCWDDIRQTLAQLGQQNLVTDRQMQETDRRMQETDRYLQENARQLRQLQQQIGGIGDKFGYFAEGMALPSMERLLIERFGMESISPRHRVRRAGREQEYDVLAWADGEIDTAIVVEVKSRVKRDAIAQILEQIQSLPQMVPQMSGKSRLGILAGVDWDDGVMQEAQAAGLLTACICDDLFEITAGPGFVPRRF